MQSQSTFKCSCKKENKQFFYLRIQAKQEMSFNSKEAWKKKL